jgi:hypothetical protein
MRFRLLLLPDFICNFSSAILNSSMTLFVYCSFLRCSLFRCIRISEYRGSEIGFGIKLSDDVNNLCYYSPMPDAFSQQGSLSSACADLNAIRSLFVCLSPNAVRFQDSACRDPRSVDRSRFSTLCTRSVRIYSVESLCISIASVPLSSRAS